MGRFFVPREAVRGNRIVVEGEEAHHIRNVMRLKESDEVVVFDGQGREYAGVIRETGPHGVVIDVLRTRELPVAGGVSLTLAQAIPKKEKMDYIVEKATELGVRRIVPIRTERTVVAIAGEKGRVRAERWRRIAREAAKQCGSPTIPAVEEVVDFDAFVRSLKGYDMSLMACLAGEVMPVKEALKTPKPETLLIFIGPEGDFTKKEIALARSNGARLVSLGPRVLKSDTAGLVLITMVQYEYGD